VRTRQWVATLLLGSASLSCGEHDDGRVLTSQGAVESAQRSIFYDVAFAPARSLGAVAQAMPTASSSEQHGTFVRELAVQALPYWSSGSITVPALTGVGGTVLMAPAPASSRVRYSCGATLISPSYAITAGHCPTVDTKLDELELQMYRPTEELAATWQKTVVLSGTWPELSHPLLEAADGYLLDSYPCQVKTRCFAKDVHENCQNLDSDVAVLECEGRPGDKYGFVNVSTSPASGKEALMHWKHEVLDVHVGDSIPQAYVDHYVRYPQSPEQNFHYFETGNQLLPLRSVPWPDGSPTRFVNATQVDVHGCHGSSGSGILAREGASTEYRLVGPVATGGPSLSGRLCQQVPSDNGFPSGPGTNALGVDFASAQTLLDQYASELTDDCRARKATTVELEGLPFSAGSHRVSTLFSFLTCQLDAFASDGKVIVAPSLTAYPERFIDDTTPGERLVQGFTLEAGADYRAALHVQELASCADCEEPRLRVGEAFGTLAPLVGTTTQLSLTFRAEVAGPVEIGVSNHGTKLAVGALTLIREGQLNAFDTPEDRLEAGLYVVDDDGNALLGPAPMRFTGDGSVGFRPMLLPGERMGLLRQALPPGQRFTVRLGADSFTDLECGLLGFDGVTHSRVPCQSLMVFDDSSAETPRLGFFVELSNDSAVESAALDFVAIASSGARDDDGDRVPEVLDNCPGDWNAAQGDCSEEPPTPDPGSAGSGGDAGAPSGGGAGSVEPTDGGAAGASRADGGAATSAPSEGGQGSGGSDASSAPGGAMTEGTAGGGSKTRPKPSDVSACDCRLAGAARGPHHALGALLLLLAGTARRRRGSPRTIKLLSR
jgi:hypothetical protein